MLTFYSNILLAPLGKQKCAVKELLVSNSAVDRYLMVSSGLKKRLFYYVNKTKSWKQKLPQSTELSSAPATLYNHSKGRKPDKKLRWGLQMTHTSHA